MFNMSDHIPFDDHMLPHDMFFGHGQSLQGSVDGSRGQPLSHSFRETLIVAHPVAPY